MFDLIGNTLFDVCTTKCQTFLEYKKQYQLASVYELSDDDEMDVVFPSLITVNSLPILFCGPTRPTERSWLEQKGQVKRR